MSSRKRSGKLKNVAPSKHSKSTVMHMETLSSASQTTDDELNESLLVLLKELKYKYELRIDKEGTNFFIQDDYMKKFYKYYPEYLCIDIVCQIPELEQFLVLFNAADSNGHCEIVAVSLIKCEALQGFPWICDMFKKHNPSWDQIEMILFDQRFNSQTLKSAFPEKIIFTSFFHCMKALKNDLTNLDNVSEEDINKALQLFEKMMFETSEAGYTDMLKAMKQIHTQVFNLFKKKWHIKRNVWALGLMTDSKTFLKAFNIYLLNIRRKLKPVICSQESVLSVIRNLHSSIFKLRKEWFQHITKMFHSPVPSYLKNPIMQEYSKILTPFGVELVYEQLTKSNAIKNVQKIDRQSYYNVNGTLATFNSCCCNFKKFMKLPCSHILCVRKHLSLPQFVQSVGPTWIFTNYSNTYGEMYSTHAFEHDESRATEMRRRFEEYIGICCNLWSKIFNCDEKVSQERLEIFQNILKCWKNGFCVTVVQSEKEANFFDNVKNVETEIPTDDFTQVYGISNTDLDSENEFIDDPSTADEFINAPLSGDDVIDFFNNS